MGKKVQEDSQKSLTFKDSNNQYNCLELFSSFLFCFFFFCSLPTELEISAQIKV